MVYNRSHVEKLLSAAEMKLFEASVGKELRSLSAAKLADHIARARRLRDKQRDLLRRQRLSTRRKTGTKGGPRGDANLRTEQKGKVFEEALSRFEARLAELGPAEPKAAAAKKPAPGQKHRGEQPTAKAKAKGKSKAQAKAKSNAKAQAAPRADAATRSGTKSKTKAGNQARTEPGALAKGKPRKEARKSAPKAAAPPDGDSASDGLDASAGTAPGRRPAAVQPGAVPPPTTRSAFVSQSAKIARQRQQPGRALQQKIRAHDAARGRRNQARRDRR